MTITRWFPAMVLTATLAGGPAAAQFDPRPIGYPGVGRTTPAAGMHDPGSGVRPATGTMNPRTNPIERVSMNSVPGSDPTEPLPPGVHPLPVATSPVGGTSLPAGSYASPWLTDAPGCGGPIGANGPVTYELYATTGVNFVSGSDLTDHLNPGVVAGAGGRSFLFNPEATAAWTIDLGFTYTYNRGVMDDPFFALNKGTIDIDPIFGTQTVNPPFLQNFRLRALHRTSFNYAFGRDNWLLGPGAPGYESGWNMRWGWLVGGKWGTAHVDMVPVGEDNGYYRNQATFLGAFVDLHMNWEVPVGSWILFGGFGVQYGYDWMNIIPPLNSDISNVNIMMTAGTRF